MQKFKIEFDNTHWLGKDSSIDLCLHGHVYGHIGDEAFDYDDATISATALYLMKSYFDDHHIGKEIQIIPCCGFNYYPNDTLTKVQISGCPNGIDFDIIHVNDKIKINYNYITIELDYSEYKEEILKFVNKVELEYINSPKKVLPKDDYEVKGYKAFWNEWKTLKDELKEKK